MIIKNNFVTSVHLRWMVLPICAYALSWMTGVLFIALFPVLLTVSHYLTLKVHSAVSRPVAWFFTLPVTFLFWVKWGPAAAAAHPNGILWGIVACYASQFINALFIPLVTKDGKPEFLMEWLIVNAVSLLLWLGFYTVYLKIIIAERNPVTVDSPALLIVFPVIVLLANGISGFFWKDKSNDAVGPANL